MALILLISSFLLFIVAYSKYSNSSFDVFIRSFFSQILSILVVSEILSFFSKLDQSNIRLSWLLVNISLFCLNVFLYKGFKFQFKIEWPKFTKTNGVLIGIFVLLIIQGIAYPPNNYDAMTYHLARIPNWLANHSLEHYPTNIYRQLYQPPLSSLILMHINVLSYSDYFSNLLQTGFLFVALVIVKQIGQILGVKKISLMLLLLITIPSVILQASSVTNNIIESVFVLIALLYALKILQEFTFSNFVFFGLASGFCLLTKGTAYIFIGPIFLMTGLHLIYFKKNIFKLIGFISLSLIICLLINSLYYQRNFELTGNLLGTDKIESQKYSNANISFEILGSNSIKNIGINFGPYPLNKLAVKIVYAIHSFLGIDINAPGSNFDDFKYSITSSPNSEDNAPSFLHFLLCFLCTLKMVFSRKKNQMPKSSWFILEIILVQFLLFNLVLKWQPWHARNMIAMFFEFVPLTALFLIDVFPKRNTNKLFFILITYALALIIFNRLRPLYGIAPLTSNINIKSMREKKYFVDRMVLADEFQKINSSIGHAKNMTIGVNLFWNEYEYPFFRNCYISHLKPFHILNDFNPNPSVRIKRNVVTPDYIVSSRTYLNVIYFNSFTYSNLTVGNKYISLYKKNK